MTEQTAGPDTRISFMQGFGPAFEVVNPDGRAGLVLVCEHASPVIPPALDDLGIVAEARRAHVAWDIGADGVARRLAALLDAPLVAARVSRLVYDCNRPPEAPDAMPARSEVFEVPGNARLDATARAARVDAIYNPFHDALASVLAARGGAAAVVSIHSFTRVWHGTSRTVQLGLLHGADDRLARAMIEAVRTRSKLAAALNEPYGPADGVLHTLDRHATPRGLPNAMVELRNDLIAGSEGQRAAADLLAEVISDALPQCGRDAR